MRRQNNLYFTLSAFCREVAGKSALGAWVQRRFDLVNEDEAILGEVNL